MMLKVADVMQYCFICRLENPAGQKFCIRCKRPIVNQSDSVVTGWSSSLGPSQVFASKVVVARSKNDIVIKNTMTSSMDASCAPD